MRNSKEDPYENEVREAKMSGKKVEVEQVKKKYGRIAQSHKEICYCNGLVKILSALLLG